MLLVNGDTRSWYLPQPIGSQPFGLSRLNFAMPDKLISSNECLFCVEARFIKASVLLAHSNPHIVLISSSAIWLNGFSCLLLSF